MNITRTEALKRIEELGHEIHNLANFTLSDAYRHAVAERDQLRAFVGQWGCSAQHMPGHTTTIWYDTRAEAVESARDANRQPWNRNSNRAALISPTGKPTRSY